jgi:pimeloyl-ACP methyl ester carboxylesterase
MNKLSGTIILIVLITIVSIETCCAQPQDVLVLDRMGLFYVGGRIVEVNYPDASNPPVSGEHQWIEQSLIHYFIPKQGHHVPVIMVPGLDLTSYIYLGTPDGRKGWAQLFAERGFDVYLFSDPLTNPSGGFNISPFNAAKKGDASASAQGELKTWTMEPVWSQWGFGPTYGTPYADVRFPIDDVNQFYAGLAIRHEMPAGSGRFGVNFKAAALVELMEKINHPAILIGHSAGASTVLKAAQTRPDLLLGFVLIEQAFGTPDGSEFPSKAMLGVYGDYIVERGQETRKQKTEEAAQSFNENGGVGAVISMPEDYGVFGNTHIMMQDNNNDMIANLIIDWLETAGVVEPKICPTADVNRDCKVNLFDLALLANQWLMNND